MSNPDQNAPNTGFVAGEHQGMMQAQPSLKELARHAIPLIEKKIWEQFHMRATLGAELECSLYPSPELKNLTTGLVHDNRRFDGNPFMLPCSADIKGSVDWAPNPERPDKQKSTLFPDHPGLCYSYYEDVGYDGEKSPAEFVFSHKAADDGKSPALTLSGHISDIAQRLSEAAASHQGTEISARDLEALKSGTAEERNAVLLRHLTQVSFEPFLQRVPLPGAKPQDISPYSQGIHVNAGLVGRNGQTIFDKSKAETYENIKTLKEALLAASSEAEYLLAPGEGGQHRLSHLFKGINASATVGIKNRDKPGIPYCHNRIASSDADPDITLLINMVGLYRGAEAIHRNRDLRQRPSPFSFDNEKARLKLQTGTFIRDVLNEVEAGLGNRFQQTLEKECGITGQMNDGA